MGGVTFDVLGVGGVTFDKVGLDGVVFNIGVDAFDVLGLTSGADIVLDNFNLKPDVVLGSLGSAGGGLGLLGVTVVTSFSIPCFFF